MIGICSNMEIEGSVKIKWNFIYIQGHNKKIQGHGYYMPGLGDT